MWLVLQKMRSHIAQAIHIEFKLLVIIICTINVLRHDIAEISKFYCYTYKKGEEISKNKYIHAYIYIHTVIQNPITYER